MGAYINVHRPHHFVYYNTRHSLFCLVRLLCVFFQFARAVLHIVVLLHLPTIEMNSLLVTLQMV